MTNRLEIVKAYSDALAVDMTAAMDYLSDDFHTADPDGNVVLTKDGFVSMGEMMRASFTDFTWVTTEIHEEGDRVIFSGHNEGTHTSDLDRGKATRVAARMFRFWSLVSVSLMMRVPSAPNTGSDGLETHLIRILVLGIDAEYLDRCLWIKLVEMEATSDDM